MNRYVTRAFFVLSLAALLTGCGGSSLAEVEGTGNRCYRSAVSRRSRASSATAAFELASADLGALVSE